MNNDVEQFTDLELEGMSHGNNPVANAYRELLAFRIAAKQAKPVFIDMPEGQAIVDIANAGIYSAGLYFSIHRHQAPKGFMQRLPIYLNPQPAHTEQDDTRRMNWLVSQNVEVRIPMLYGSHARFVAQCDSDDCEEYHTTLREQIDAAMLAAAPKPESE